MHVYRLRTSPDAVMTASLTAQNPHVSQRALRGPSS
jgi:hypothetical protein